MNDCVSKKFQHIPKNSSEEDAVILDCITKAKGQISQVEREEIDQLLAVIISDFNQEGGILLTTDELEDVKKGKISERVRNRLEFVLKK